jgi:hypothetical protein
MASKLVQRTRPTGDHCVIDSDHEQGSRSDPIMTCVEDYGTLPLSFEANQGQADPRVKFLARGSGYRLFLTATEAVLSLQQPTLLAGKESSSAYSRPGSMRGMASTGAVLVMRLVNANPTPEVIGRGLLPGKSNYFIGNNPNRWVTNVTTYDGVCYRNVYPGVDLVHYGIQGQLEYDFVLAPGRDPGLIVLDFEGASDFTVTAAGDLVLETPAGQVCQRAPFVYQDKGGCRHEVGGRYVRAGARRVGFEVGTYDTRRPLVIDPVLVYSTYLETGGIGPGIAVDAGGNAYVTGSTTSAHFPTTSGAFQPSNPHLPTSFGDSTVAFVTKLNAAGSALVYSTYLGGTAALRSDWGQQIAVDRDGNAYVTGATTSEDFPTTGGAFQQSTSEQNRNNAFVSKLNPAGSALDYSTYLGGTGYDTAFGIAVDVDRNAYIVGETTSKDFPTTPDAFQASIPDPDHTNAFVTKLNRQGTTLVYSTYLGGTGVTAGYAIALDRNGNAYVTGSTESADFPTTPNAFQPENADPGNRDAFVTKLNRRASQLVYSTYLGGTGDDVGFGIAVDGEGNAYVAGGTSSGNFPTTPNAFQPSNPTTGNFDAFVSKLNPTGSALVYSTYLGGTRDDAGGRIAVDEDGNAYVVGQAASNDFPATPGGIPPANPSSESPDAFVAKLNPAGSALVYSTYLGGTGNDVGVEIAVDKDGNAYVAGRTTSNDFPTTPGGFQPSNHVPGEANFVAKFREQ